MKYTDRVQLNMEIILFTLVVLLVGAGCGITSTPAASAPIPTIDSAPSDDQGIPVIQSVELREDTSSGELVIYQDVHFTDSSGDVFRWDFEIVSSTNSDVNVEGGNLDIPSEEQKSGAVATGTWGCGNANYSVTLSVTLTDRIGQQSAPYEYTLECDTGIVEVGERYTEPAGGFSYIPPAGWEIVDFQGLEYKIARGAATGTFTPNINFIDEEFSGTLDSYVDASVSSIPQAIPGAMVAGLEEFTTNAGQRCIKVIIESTQSGMQLNQVLYFFDAGAKKIIATYTRLADSGQEIDAWVDQSMKTFRVEE